MPIIMSSELSIEAIRQLCIQNKDICDEIAVADKIDDETIQELAAHHLGIGIDIENKELMFALSNLFNHRNIRACLEDKDGIAVDLFETNIPYLVFDNDYFRNKIFSSKRNGNIIIYIEDNNGQENELINLNEQEILSIESIHENGFSLELNIDNDSHSTIIVTGAEALEKLMDFKSECKIFEDLGRGTHHSSLFDARVKFHKGIFSIH